MMDEVFKYQKSIIDSMENANARYTGNEIAHNLDEYITRAREYQEKIVNLKKSLSALQEKSTKIRKHTDKILDNKCRQDAEQQRSRERREALERHLEPVVNTRRS